jgi:WD40 repeat protein
MAEGLPTAAAAAPGGGTVTAWWELRETARYPWEHLIEHMLAAGRADLAEELTADLRWAGARLQASGPAGLYADLALIGTPRTRRLGQLVEQATHLLTPTVPPHSLTDILHSRISHDPEWAAQAQRLAASRNLPALINLWPLPDLPDQPDLPDPALRRVLTGYTGALKAIVISPDATWLACASSDGSLHIWDLATDRHAAFNSHVTGMAISPDGTWLATASRDRSVRIWDPATRDISAVMRVDRPLGDCTWNPSSRSIAIAGGNDLYLFTFKP